MTSRRLLKKRKTSSVVFLFFLAFIGRKEKDQDKSDTLPQGQKDGQLFFSVRNMIIIISPHVSPEAAQPRMYVDIFLENQKNPPGCSRKFQKWPIRSIDFARTQIIRHCRLMNAIRPNYAEMLQTLKLSPRYNNTMNACTAVDGLLQLSRYQWTCPVLGWFEHTTIYPNITHKNIKD